MKITKRKMLRVVWLDSKGDDGTWLYIEDIKPMQPAICESVGFLLEQSDEHITLVANQGGEQICGRMCIPRVAIKEIVQLRNAKTLK